MAKYTTAQRIDNEELNKIARVRLLQRGMVLNEANTETFRAKLKPFYARWKEMIGSQCWALLERHAGRIG